MGKDVCLMCQLHTVVDGERCLFDVSTAHCGGWGKMSVSCVNCTLWWMGKDVCLMCQLHTVVDGERCLFDVSTAHCGGWGKMSV